MSLDFLCIGFVSKSERCLRVFKIVADVNNKDKAY